MVFDNKLSRHAEYFYILSEKNQHLVADGGGVDPLIGDMSTIESPASLIIYN